ncbi:MAG TPA: bifunctional phosphoribosylaminoimidazolecarboxamide formyltransferase/IMP cyclohydrolase [Planctomycetota bacterium]|nr:bifunctional phosphoribosylaminoimidazolecarboxamide formyltransferase/IMP cyclohydrolase [Planctomycetota bacterium]
MSDTPIRRALLSVSDKTGLTTFAAGLRKLGVEVISTGGTGRALGCAGITITDVEAFTGFPEMLDGRVKTLHPNVHAGILYRRDDPAHVQAMQTHDLRGIDLVAVNLYPFEETVARPGVTREEAVEEIDIGGPSLLRAAAKNHAHVTVVSSPSQYNDVLREMGAGNGSTTLELRRRLALEAFRRTAAYDAAIQRFFGALDALDPGTALTQSTVETQKFPSRLEISLPRAEVLRYGENPHQAAALYGDFLERFRKLHGKDLSYNNITDLTAAQEMAEWVGRRGPAVAIIKHTNPCGLAVGSTVAEAWMKALATDSKSASGGIVASSRRIDAEAAAAMQEHFIDVLVAPGFDAGALELLRKKKNRIILDAVVPSGSNVLAFRSVPGGVLVQTPDDRPLLDSDLCVMTRRAPSREELDALRFGWDVARFVKSNAIVYSAADRTLGIGAGQMSRVDSARIGVMKAREAGIDLAGSVVASDAFFPFPDGLLVAADAGATAVIQPGGSIRDKEVIEAADSRGMAMVFTGLRHFRHG